MLSRMTFLFSGSGYLAVHLVVFMRGCASVRPGISVFCAVSMFIGLVFGISRKRFNLSFARAILRDRSTISSTLRRTAV